MAASRLALHGGALSILLWAAQGNAQTLTLTAQAPPQGILRSSDLWNSILIQTGPTPVTVTLRVKLQQNSGETAYEALAAAREFSPGTHSLSSRDLDPITVIRASQTVESALSRTGAFPDGHYSLCLEAIDPAGAPIVSSSCVDVTVASVLSPIPIAPPNRGTTSDPFVVWTWFMQPATAAGEPVSCDLRVVEILGGQTPEEALRRNPPVILRENLRTSIWQTNEAVRHLISGGRYAWRLTARVGNSIAAESEIWSFTYQAPETESLVPAMSLVTPSRADSALAGESQTSPSESVAPEIAAAAAPDSTPTDVAISPAAPGDSLPRPLQLKVVARATVESSNRPGALSRTPSDYGRLELDPTLLIYGSPLGLSLLLSTEPDPQRNEIRRGTLGFSGRGSGLGIHQRIEQRTQELKQSREALLSDTLREVRDELDRLDSEITQLNSLAIADPTANLRELERLGLLSSSESSALKIPAFAFGSVTPNHGRLLLHDATINGGMIEVQPDHWFTSIAAGKLARATNDQVTLPPTPTGTQLELYQDLYSGMVGVGRRSASYLALTALYSRDDRQTRAIMELADPQESAPVQENVVVGLAGQAFTGGGLLVDGDIQASMFTLDRTGSRLVGSNSTGTLRGLFGSPARENTAVDWAGGLRSLLTLDNGRSRLSSAVRFVGPGYNTVGVRDLRRDNFQYEGSWDQKLSRDRLALNSQWAIDHTGIVFPRSGMARVYHLTSRLSGEVKPLPAVEVSYSIDHQNQRAGGADQTIHSRTQLGSIRLHYRNAIGVARAVTMLAGDVLIGESNDQTGSHRSTGIQLNEFISLPSRLGVIGRASRTRTTTAIADDREPDVWAWETSFAWTEREFLSTSAGLTGTSSVGLVQTGVFLGATLGLGSLGTIDVSWSITDGRSRSPETKGFTDRRFRLQLLTHEYR